MQYRLTYILLFLSAVCCSGPLLSQSAPRPVFSFPAGYYSDSVVISITSSLNGSQIRYTLNGSEPTPGSALYTSPLVIKDRSPQADNFSTIPTNPGFNYVPGYDTSRSDSRGWLPPYSNSFKGTVLKAKIFRNNYLSDSTATASYFITPSLSNRYGLPVLSLSVDSIDFFSNESGIYVYGFDTASFGNYSAIGPLKKIHLEFFETDGSLKISQYCDVKEHGNGGRHAPQKSLQLIANGAYGHGKFRYRFFTDKITGVFERILLRNSGHRPDCTPRDDLHGEIMKGLMNEVQDTRHCIVFLNGEYWGIQSIKDILSDDYFYHRYNMPKGSVTLLGQTGTLDDGAVSSEQAYASLLDFVKANDLNVPSNYDYVRTQLEPQSFTDFQCAEIYLGNGDWPNNNTKFWRYNRQSNDTLLNNYFDGRWRWITYDLDAGFGGDCKTISASYNALKKAVDSTFLSYTLLLRNLIKNNDYRNYFINRYADLLNTAFLPQRITSAVNSVSSEMLPEMMEHVTRWRYPSVSSTLASRAGEIPSLTKWNSIQSGLLAYAQLRPSKSRMHFINYFSLADTVKITVNVNDSTMGKVKLNTLYLDKWLLRNYAQVYPWTGTYFNGNPVSLEALARPGYKLKDWNSAGNTNTHLTVNISSDTLITAVFEADTAFHAKHYLYINELSAANKSGIIDEYNQHDDWVELY
ncbi:MAG: CotH kinase family protein, partial [Bacteroidia bacterium]